MTENNQLPHQDSAPPPVPSDGGNNNPLQNFVRKMLGFLRLGNGSKGKFSAIGGGVVVVLILLWLLGWYWSWEPDMFEVKARSQAIAEERQQLVNDRMVVGYVTTATLIEVARTLLEKQGGYLSNDVLPPSVFMDNMPNWEFGVLVQIRDFSRAMRNDISRSQTQSIEDPDLSEAEPKFNFNNSSWLFPPSESQYRAGIEHLESYQRRLTDDDQRDAQFFTRADNLRDWLKTVEKRLGSLSQRLSASVGQDRVNTDLAGEPEGRQAKQANHQMAVKTPWLEIDDVFYEARGTAWALIHLLRAVEVDFKDVLQKNNALVSLPQIIRELEVTHSTIWRPMILNGSEFGLFANHSLVMSSYISRANAATIDLRSLLSQG